MLLAGQLDSEVPLVFDAKINHFCWRFEGCCFQVSSDEDWLQAQNPHKQLHSEEPCLSAPCQNANTHCTMSYRSYTLYTMCLEPFHPNKNHRRLEGSNQQALTTHGHSQDPFTHGLKRWLKRSKTAKRKGEEKHMGILDPKNCIKQCCDVHWNFTFNSHEAFSRSLHLCICIGFLMEFQYFHNFR